MLKNLLLLAVCCCFAHHAQAQFLWQQETGTSALYESTSGGFLLVPGGYLSVGRSYGTINNPNYLYFSKLASTGAVLWQKPQMVAHRNIYSMEVLSAAADASGQFYVTGQATELVPQHSASLYSFGVLAKFTATGDTIWSRVVRGNARAAYARVVVTADGGAVVTGANDTEHFIAKFSATGQELWHRSYVTGSVFAGYLIAIAQLPGGGFIVAQAENYLTGQPAHYLLLDSQGLLLSTRPARSYTSHALCTDAASNILDAAGRYFYKLSPQGDTLWSRQYTQSGATVYLNLVVPVPGTSGYLLAGTRTNSFSDRDISLILVDNNGNKLRDMLLVRYSSNESATGIQFDSQGNYVVGCWTDDNGPIGHADQLAFALPNWNYLLPTHASTAALACKVYPNPAGAGERVRVTLAGLAYTGAYELRYLTGQLVREGAALPAQGLAVSGLPAGIYLLQVQQQGIWLPAMKLQVSQ